MFEYKTNKKPTWVDILKGKWKHFWYDYTYYSNETYGGSSNHTKKLKKQLIYNIIILLFIIFIIYNQIIK